METLKSLVDWMTGMVEDDDDDSIASYKLWINDAIQTAAKGFTWDTLRREHDATVSSGAFTAPPLFASINKLWKDEGYVVPTTVFHRRGERPVDEGLRPKGHWYLPNGVKLTAGTTYTNASVSKGSQSVTGTVPATGDVGKLVVFDGYASPYEILTADGSTMTVYPPFSGTDSSTQDFVVDGPGQRQYLLYDEEDVLFSGDVTLSYQMLHPTLAHDDDLLLVAAEKTVKLLALQHAQRQNKYDVDAQRLAVDLEEAKRLEMTYPDGMEPEVILPRGLVGQSPMFSSQSRKHRGQAGWNEPGYR